MASQEALLRRGLLAYISKIAGVNKDQNSAIDRVFQDVLGHGLEQIVTERWEVERAKIQNIFDELSRNERPSELHADNSMTIGSRLVYGDAVQLEWMRAP